MPTRTLCIGSSPLARGLPLAAIEDQVHDRIIPARAGFTCQPHWGHTPYPDHPRSRGVYPIGHRLHRGLDGSSPLARGLPRIQSGAGYLPRIIPARAGFTTGLRIVEASLQDHPRSRGVYLSMERFSIKTSGSSPLARGLLQTSNWRISWVGIIPARAGFTTPSQYCRPTHSDHPRSRGVYPTMLRTMRTMQGSSPLARGLPDSRCKILQSKGIIPARAGFTGCSGSATHRYSDHPRSRGVYFETLCGVTLLLGSSPLARGLLDDAARTAYDARIIPARAGFTVSDGENDNRQKDHPRSRGVYGALDADSPGVEGSSPLARGLRGWMVGLTAQRGIIPARAGFTGASARIMTVDSDHPRSRGVYPPSGRRLASSQGSSPLARGLRLTRAGVHPLPGIIPARAGFTVDCGWRSGPLGDHPRSRGVYTKAISQQLKEAGSSPLARGLPANKISNLPSCRIIPARAGFTPRNCEPAPATADHPRSRGVYASRSRTARLHGGSSPLARGLRKTVTRDTVTSRIIPARAGFTRTRRSARSSATDHPRSRGVYLLVASEASMACGSSPLARGLHRPGGRPARVAGIIPARAGFTGDEEGVGGGVRGSSPLARGLPMRCACPFHRGGIIPARAGFTSPPGSGSGSTTDHPRSRGVYRSPRRVHGQSSGSSPLARGLLDA